MSLSDGRRDGPPCPCPPLTMPEIWKAAAARRKNLLDCSRFATARSSIVLAARALRKAPAGARWRHRPSKIAQREDARRATQKSRAPATPPAILRDATL
eukprot:scaffold1439_cov282-Pinguiococcus_pyrenoidosus.AAC.5